MSARLTRRALVLVVLAATIGCSNDNDRPPISMTPTTPTTPTVIADVIEYRVFGDVGASPVAVRYLDSINGTTVLPAIGLPYVARVSSTQSSLFLFVEATSPGGIVFTTTPVLQVQIVINGQLFREGFATGFAALQATASGTWRR